MAEVNQMRLNHRKSQETRGDGEVKQKRKNCSS